MMYSHLLVLPLLLSVSLPRSLAAEDVNSEDTYQSVAEPPSEEDTSAMEKRYAKTAFYGSRGKKPRPFFGMRGRRTEQTDSSNWDDYNSDLNSYNIHDSRSPQSDDMADLIEAVRQREELGGYGQHMLKRFYNTDENNSQYPVEDELNVPDKRKSRYRPSPFLGMRGKKMKNPAFFGVRGKRDSLTQNSNLQKIIEALLSRRASDGMGAKRTYKAFYGMRG